MSNVQETLPKPKAIKAMGISSSTINDKANDQAFIRFLGERYPLGDAELRKWCWCYIALHRSSVPSISSSSISSCCSGLTSLAIWSAIYSDPGPTESIIALNERLESSRKLSRAISLIEEHILPVGLGSRIIAGLDIKSLKNKKSPQPAPLPPFPKPTSSNGEILAWAYSYYSIKSMTIEFLSSGSVSQEFQNFLEGISTSCGRRGSRYGLSKLFNLATLSTDQGRKSADASELIDIAYRLTVATSYFLKAAAGADDEGWKAYLPADNSKGKQSMVGSLINSVKKQREGSADHSSYALTTINSRSPNTNGCNVVFIEEFIEWAEATVPMMACSLSTFLHVIFNFFSQKDEGSQRFPPGLTPLLLPAITIDQKGANQKESLSSFFTEANTSFDLFALACTSITLSSGRFHRLFSSEADGLSCNRLMHAIFGYDGPTLIIIRSADVSGKCGAGIFGAFTFSPWDKESGGFYGSSDCFLFRLGPEPMGVYRPKGSGGNDESNFMFFNPEARSKGYDQLAWGIGFGGTTEDPRLYIDEILSGCTAKDKDLTFDNGSLLSNKDNSNSLCAFEVEAIEAFGVGSSQVIEDALAAREENRLEAQKRIRNAMKGAKAAFLEDMQSGLVGAKVFKHRDEIRGREETCSLEKEG